MFFSVIIPLCLAGQKNEIYVLNSSGATILGSFVQQQLALIMDTDEKSFPVIYPRVKDQLGGGNACGPLAIAYATQLAFSEKVTYVDFKLDELRPHLLKCLKAKELQPFPRNGEELPTKRLKIEEVKVFCACRLPENYDENAIFCSRCKEWCHYKCNDLTHKPLERRWICKRCKACR